MKVNKKRKGFTLIELIVVIAILGILAAILIPKFTGFQDRARSTQALVNAKNIATALDGYIAEGKTLSTTVTDGTHFQKDDVLKEAGITLGASDSLTLDGTDTTHPGFTYNLYYNTTTTYKCVRSDDGKGTYNVTW